MVTSSRADPVAFNLRQRAAALERQIAELELKWRGLGERIALKREQLQHIEQRLEEEIYERGEEAP